MQRLSRLVAVAAVFGLLPAGALLAQSPPNTTTAPAAAAPGAAPAPAATSAATTATEPATPAKKKKAKKMTLQQEIDKSIDSGTVPARYRSSVPKEYQHHIPFAK